MRWRAGAILVLAGCIIGCAAFGSPGEPSKGFLNSAVAAAYLPLDGNAGTFMVAHGAATVVAPGVAATNAHNANLVVASTVVGVSQHYDLLFFHTARMDVPPAGRPWIGEMVIAYGQGALGELREARGNIRSLNASVEPMCRTCPVQQVFAFEAAAGRGFSGGPVADASNGRIVGIVFGYSDMKGGVRLIYAYDMERILAELSGAYPRPAQKAAPQP